MPQGRSQFVGTAGQFYVAYSLAVRSINASLTLGNAPSVDVLASSADGRRTLAIQVKTQRNAYRGTRYGKGGCYEWDVGASVIGKQSRCFWYALVDLRESSTGWNPVVFFVPSRWMAEYVKPEFSRKMYILPGTAVELTRERWDLVRDFLDGKDEAVAWAGSWPPEAKWV